MTTRWISWTSSSPDSVVGSTGGWSRRRSRIDRVDVGVGRQRPEIAERGELPLHVVRGGAHHQPEEREPAGLGEPADDAEVEQRGAPIGLHEQVAAVQVAVEDAVDHRPLHEGDHPGADHRGGVDAGATHALDVVEREAGQPLHHQHAPRHEAGVRARHDVAALTELREHPRDVEHVLRFEPEVELLGDRLREQLDERRRVGERGDRDAADQMRREPRHRGEVLPHERRDLRPLHLHDHLLAGAQRGGVHLRDRRRGERHAFERREDLLEGASELVLDDLAHGVEGLRRYSVATELELAHELLREEPLAGGDDLPELDVRRPEVRGGNP